MDTILEVRAMSPKESNAFNKRMAELAAEYPNNADGTPNPKTVVAMVDYIIDNIYPGTKDELYANEQMAIANRTIELSNEIRYERIKNLPKPSDGSTNGATIANPADK